MMYLVAALIKSRDFKLFKVPKVVDEISKDCLLNSYLPRYDRDIMAKPQGDETNYLTAFDPGNRRGINPVYSVMLSSSSIDVHRFHKHSKPDSIQKNESAGRGSYHLSVPLVRLLGRGLDLALDLTYDSLVWHKNGNNLSFNIDNDWPAPGWSLGFGKLIRTGWRNFLLFGANGMRQSMVFKKALQSSPTGMRTMAAPMMVTL